jgi:p-cumate 2,3-dioxygenase beta subunit
LITNVGAHTRADGLVAVIANFAVFRMRNGITDIYFGQYRHLLESDPQTGFRFALRQAVLDLDALRPLGKISIIL